MIGALRFKLCLFICIISISLQTKKALESAKDDFNNQNQALKEDLPKLLEGKIDYFQPSFEALIRSQVCVIVGIHSQEISGINQDV